MSATASAADTVHAAIAAAGGAIRFDRYVELALYGPGGFYTAAGGRAGRRGDFLTSPEVGPLFAAVLGSALDETWDELGRPDRFTVVDAGAGPGTLARGVTAAGLRCAGALDYVAVEVSAHQRAAHPSGITSTDRMPDGPITGVIVANELLDNLPFRLLVHDGGWREAWVSSDGDGFVEVLRPLDGPVPAGVPSVASLGARLPVLDAACAWVADARARVRAGRVLVLDYGVATTAELAGRPWREWLRTYAGHGRGAHYLRDPGAQDITTDVPVDQIVAARGPALVRTQREALRAWGIDGLVAEGARAWPGSGASLEALRMRSRVREADALLDPAGLGGFLCVEWRCHPE